MVPLNQLTADSILSDEVLSEVFDQEDEIYKARLLLSLEDRAGELGRKHEFQELVKAYKRVERAMNKAQKEKPAPATILDNWTNFSDCPYERMQCSNWLATDDGVFIPNPNPGSLDIQACYHPIIPVERLKNLETGKEQIKLAYRRNGSWRELIVPKGIVTSNTKIVSLSELGISVTSENARYLVKYLADVENLNEDYINIQYSSSKLGWIKDDFLPYDTDIVFDGDIRFKQLFESIEQKGSREIWYAHIKELRKGGCIETKFLLAASFSSILVSLLGGLPFIVDLWGETEGGKTVSLMVAASVWANPGENRYIGDFKTTDVALEAKADMLNNLPMILDDTSKVSARIRDNFEGFIYDLCSGKGKSRSNKELGINRENIWNLVTLTNGERPIQSYVSQGGAINRVLEVECGEKVYQDPQSTANILKRNYGYAGKDFVEAVKKIGIDDIRIMQQEIQKQLFSDDKMQKQAIALSIVLTADRIATEYLFKDNCSISIEEAKKTLVDRSEVSDNERCYHYLIDKITMNDQRFDTDTHCEKWGEIELPGVEYDTRIAIIQNQAMDMLCKEGGFSKKSFLSWAKKKNLLITENGRTTKVKKMSGVNVRCVWLKMVEDVESETVADFSEMNDSDIVFD
ncbi:DUF927 domain-containing protein [Blautia sp.]|uniref:DUF927 domain-containing protein n=1 Tax=Blautia sp. TaxID=1955243 RepID=UPI003AB15041